MLGPVPAGYPFFPPTAAVPQGIHRDRRTQCIVASQALLVNGSVNQGKTMGSRYRRFRLPQLHPRGWPLTASPASTPAPDPIVESVVQADVQQWVLPTDRVVGAHHQNNPERGPGPSLYPQLAGAPSRSGPLKFPTRQTCSTVARGVAIPTWVSMAREGALTKKREIPTSDRTSLKIVPTTYLSAVDNW